MPESLGVNGSLDLLYFITSKHSQLFSIWKIVECRDKSKSNLLCHC